MKCNLIIRLQFASVTRPSFSRLFFHTTVARPNITHIRSFLVREIRPHVRTKLPFKFVILDKIFRGHWLRKRLSSHLNLLRVLVVSPHPPVPNHLSDGETTRPREDVRYQWFWPAERGIRPLNLAIGHVVHRISWKRRWKWKQALKTEAEMRFGLRRLRDRDRRRAILS